VDALGKIVPWHVPAGNAYHAFLTPRWNFIKTGSFPTPGNPTYPQYFLHSGFSTTNPAITPDNWMNPISETVPNWFESARLYYAYSGDAAPLALAKALMDHSLTNGISPANFIWPNMPYTAGNAGEVLIRGFSTNSSPLNKFKPHEIMPGYAGDMGLAYFRMWQYSGEQKYLTAAINTANTLAAKARVGSATQSVWPFTVVMDTGEITSEYGANFIGCYELFTHLINANVNPSKNFDYEAARTKCRNFLLNFPMLTGCWADGHPDTAIKSNQSRSNTPKSNVALYMLDFPGFDPNFNTHLPALIAWTETWFVDRTIPPEPATYYGANIVGEQDDFNFKMDYQTARYAAECAQWFRVSGDAAYQEKAYRALNFVTYCSTPAGRPTESPFNLSIATWWGDCFGECPRMFYQAFKGMPEWAPAGQNRILYSYDVLKNVSYAPFEVAYDVLTTSGTEYFRLTYQPTDVTVGGVASLLTTSTTAPGWTSRRLPGGDYAITLSRNAAGRVRLFSTAENSPPVVSLTSPAAISSVATGSSILLAATASDANGSIAKVEFYNVPTKLGEDTTAPYHFSWNNLAAGTYTLTAVATDNQNAQAISTAAVLTVGTLSSVAFGSTNEGNSEDTMTDSSGAYINACRFPAASSMSVTTIKAKILPITGSYKCAIYSDNNGNAQTLLASSGNLTGANTGSGTTLGWKDFPLTSPINVTTVSYYWLAIWSNDNAARISALNSGTIRFAAYPFGNFPTSVNLTGTGTFTYSLNATGTATANAAPTCNVGTTQTITLPATANLTGTASDDGIPAALTNLWNYESGPGSVTFGNSSALNTTANFSLPGSYVIRLTAYDGAVTTASNVSITVNDSFAAWAARYRVPANNTDFDKDGISNLLEYALNGNPTIPSITPLPLYARPSFSFYRSQSELNYYIESSSSLNIWTTLATNPGSVGTTVTYTDTPPPGTTKRFLRLRVLQP